MQFSKKNVLNLVLITSLAIFLIMGIIFFSLRASNLPEGCEPAPLDVIVALDASGSMAKSDNMFPYIKENLSKKTKIEYVKEAMAVLLKKLDENGGIGAGKIHRVGIITFSGSVSTIVSPLGESDSATLTNVVNAISAKDYTPIGSAVETTTATFQNARAGVKRAVVILSDGKAEPNTAGPTQEAIDSLLKTTDASYSIVIGKRNVDTVLMKALAKPANNYTQLKQASELPSLFDSIATDAICTEPTTTTVTEPTTTPPASEPTTTVTTPTTTTPAATTPKSTGQTILSKYFGKPGAAPGAGGGGYILIVLIVSGLSLIITGFLRLRQWRRQTKQG